MEMGVHLEPFDRSDESKQLMRQGDGYHAQQVITIGVLMVRTLVQPLVYLMEPLYLVNI